MKKKTKKVAKPKGRLAKIRAQVMRDFAKKEEREKQGANEDLRKSTPKAKKMALAKKQRIELPTKAVADERTESLRERMNKFKGEWWEIGAAVLACLNDRVPEARKQSATAWLEEVFGGEWQRYRRAMISCKALTPAVPLDTLKQISEGNAYVLASLPEDLQTDLTWVKKAAEMKNAEFEQAVLAKRKERGDTFEKEVGIWTVFKLGRMEESFKDIVKRSFEVAAEHLARQGLEIDLSTVPGRKAALEAIFGEFLSSYTAAIDVEAQAAEGWKGLIR